MATPAPFESYDILDLEPLESVLAVHQTPRGPVLVTRCLIDGQAHIAACRGGPDPLAWMRPENVAKGERNPWLPAMPPIEELLNGPFSVRWGWSTQREVFVRRNPPFPDQYWEELREDSRYSEIPGTTVNPDPWLGLGWVEETRIVRKWMKSRGRDPVGYVEKARYTSKGRKLREELAAKHPVRRQTMREERWFRIRSEFRTLMDAYRKLPLVIPWLESFDPEALGFLKHFNQNRWALLTLWTRLPGLRSFFADNPTLAWFLATDPRHDGHPGTLPLDALRPLQDKPRKRLLEWLGLPGGEGMLRLLRRIASGGLDEDNREQSLRVLRDTTSRRLLENIQGTIDTGITELLGEGETVSLPLLQGINDMTRYPDANTGMHLDTMRADTRKMIADLGDPALARRLGSVRSPRALWELHEKCVQRINREPKTDRPPAWVTPLPPPLPPPDWLQPISTPEELYAEGRLMDHCVATYAEEIAAGQYYVFACRHPAARATLGLVLLHNGRWQIDQLSGPRNQAVPAVVHAAVRTWFREASRGFAPTGIWREDNRE